MSLRALARAFVGRCLPKFSARALNCRQRQHRRILVEGLETRRVMAVNPLLLDIGNTANSSSPNGFVEVNGVAYFQAFTRDQGVELWKTDGTPAGTQLVKDIQPANQFGSYPTNLTNVNGTLYFTAGDPTTGQPELWKSDGTAAGTVMVDGNQGSFAPSQLTAVNSTLFFVAQRQGGSGTGAELWKTDGTAAGTVLVKDIVRGVNGSQPSQLVNVAGTLYFTATTPTTGTELWKSNGTAVGTVQVRDIITGSGSPYVSNLINSGGTLYFVATNAANGRELWKSNGTSAGTVIVRDIVAGTNGSYPTYLTDVAGTVYFSSSSELWKSNGTAAGTVQIETAPGGSSVPRNLLNANGKLYFSAFGTAGDELWTSDGTAAGTVQIKNIDGGYGSSSPQQLTNVGSTLYFTATTPTTGREVFVSDGTNAGTILLKDIAPSVYTSGPTSLIGVNGKLVFVAQDPSTGNEIWSSDGTPAGTSLLQDIETNTSSGDANSSVVVGAIQYFVARTADNGVELWKTDGTSLGTSLVKDIAPGTSGSYPSDLINANGTLYFVASDAGGRELWKSNGTSAGTVRVADLNGVSSSTPQQLVNIGSTVYFTALDNNSGRELWKSNGTAATTVLVANINPVQYSGSDPNKLTAVGSTLYFTANDNTSGRELWKSNGTAAGTVLVSDIVSGSSSSYPNDLIAVGSTLYFTASDANNGREVWKSNGTAAGTAMVRNIITGAYSGSYPSQLTNVNGTLYFTAREEPGGSYELFKSNGTSAGTVTVEGTESLMSNPIGLTNVNNTLYFSAFEELGSSGSELWRSDGTLAGTQLVKDILPGFSTSDPQNLFNANGSLVFTVNLPGTGRELWKSDGTSAGTLPIVDLWPGPNDSGISNLTMLGTKLAFTADDGLSGTELFVLSPNQAPSVTLPAVPISTSEDTAVSITGLSLGDVDADVAVIEAQLTSSSGILTLSTIASGGLTASDISGNNTPAISVRGTLSAINATLASGVLVTPPTNQASPITLTVNVNDLGNIGLGAPLSASGLVTIGVVAVNDSPVANISAGPVNFTENGTATLLASLATLSDVDSADFDTGTINVALSVVDGADRLSVRNEGSGVGQIGLVGSDVSYGGVTIGSITAGASGGDLSIALNASATVVAVEALLRNLQFTNISENPNESPRILTIVVSDGDGGSTSPATVTVAVAAVNDAPQLTMPGGTLGYVENALPQVLDGAATVSDSENNLAAGSVVVAIASGADSSDRLEIKNDGFGLGQIGLSSNFILYGTAAGPVVIGSQSGGTGATPLSIALSANATTAAVEALLRNVTFRTLSDVPVVGDRTITVQVNDGLLAASNSVVKTVSVSAVNDAPVIDQLGPAVTYTENGTALVITSTATVSDVDSLDYATGVLTVTLASAGVSTDILGVRSQGSGPGQIGVSGTSVRYGGVLIGTLAGGTSLAPLTVTLNASATSAAVQALVRNVTYRNSSDAPSDLPRGVQFVLTDGDGGTSLPVSQTVNVIAVNDRAVLGSIPAAASYTENGSPVILASAANIVDVDSPNFAGGNLTVRFTAGGTADDRLAVRNEGFASGQIGVAGNSILFGGLTIGTLGANAGIGTTSLIVFLNVNATPVNTRALLRNVTFANVSDAPATAPRTIQFLLNDGDGATSTGINQVMSVTALNDAPVLTLPGPALSYSQFAPAIDLDGTATVTDSDSANFDGGSLTVSVSANATGDEILEIRNEGTGAGQIGISGADVTFGGVVIGSFAGGTLGVPLSISFNASATTTAVGALVRKLTFRMSVVIAPSVKTISFQLSDGDGGSVGGTKNVSANV